MPGLSNPQASRLGVGGTLRLDHIYVERQADKDLLALCAKSEFAYVLSSRQVGKSSLMVRTMDRLAQQGVWAASVDMTQLEQSISEERFYFSVLAEICRQLGEDSDAMEEWFFAQDKLSWVQRFVRWFETYLVTLGEQRIVIFFDEIDSLRNLAFKDDFFAAIRSLHNARALHGELKRLSFVLVGAATPEQLMSDATRTPFNVGSGVRLTDFTKQEAVELMTAVPQAGAGILDRVLYWTAGHPYLTARTVAALAEEASAVLSGETVDNVVEDLFLSDRRRSEERNLDYVRQMLQGLERGKDRPNGTLQAYRSLLKSKRMPDRPQDLAVSWLKLAGVVQVEPDQTLTLRNRIYERVFDQAWVNRHLPPPTWREVLSSFLRQNSLWLVPFVLGVAVATTSWQSSRYSDIYRQMQAKSQELEAKSAEVVRERAANEADRQKILADAARLNEEVKRSAREVEVQRALANSRGEGSAPYLAFSRANLEFDAGRFVHGALLGTEAIRRSPLLDGSVLAFMRANDIKIPEALHRAHQRGILAVAWSPDGKLVATGSFDDSVVVWSPGQGTVAVLKGHTRGVTALAWSPDQRWLATGTASGLLRRYDTASWGEPEVLAELVGTEIRAMDWSPDSRILASSGEKNTIRVWDSAANKVSAVPGHTSLVRGIRWRPDGKYLVSVADDSVVRFWRGDTLALEKAIPAIPRNTGIQGVVWSPDGTQVATANNDAIIRILDFGTWTSRELAGHREGLTTLAWNRHGVLASGSWDETVLIWRPKTNNPPQKIVGTGADIRSLDWTPDGQTLAIATMNEALWHWKENANQPVESLHGHTGSVSSIAWNPTKSLIASASTDRSLRLWDPAANRQVGPPLLGHTGSIEAVAWSTDGRKLASGGADRVLRIWSQQQDNWTSTPLPVFPQAIRSISWSRDGARLAVASEDTVSLWDAAPQRRKGAMVAPAVPAGNNRNRALSVAVLQNGPWVATGWEDGRIRLWNAETNEVREGLGHGRGVISVAWNPGGNRLVSGSWDAEVMIWDLSRDFRLSAPRKMKQPHKNDVVSVAWSPDGRRIASGSRDKWVRAWDPETGALTGVFGQQKDQVTSVAWSPDSQRIASASSDHTIAIWDDWARTVERACRIWNYPSLNPKEWAESFGDLVPYRQTCGK